MDANPDITGEGQGAVDESDMTSPISTSGDIEVEFGDDVPGSVNGNGLFSATTALKSGGQAVTVTTDVDGNWIGTAEGGDNVFTLIFDDTGIGWAFTLNKTLDHPDATDPDDEITLNFGFIAADSDATPDTVEVLWRSWSMTTARRCLVILPGLTSTLRAKPLLEGVGVPSRPTMTG